MGFWQEVCDAEGTAARKSLIRHIWEQGIVDRNYDLTDDEGNKWDVGLDANVDGPGERASYSASLTYGKRRASKYTTSRRHMANFLRKFAAEASYREESVKATATWRSSTSEPPPGGTATEVSDQHHP